MDFERCAEILQRCFQAPQSFLEGDLSKLIPPRGFVGPPLVVEEQVAPADSVFVLVDPIRLPMNMNPAHRSAPSFASSGFQFATMFSSLLRSRWLCRPRGSHFPIHPCEFVFQRHQFA